MQKIIENKLEELKSICLSLNVKKLYLFGSAATDRFTENSDIDLLISFSESLSLKQYTDNYFTFYYKLKELFQRKIDIIPEKNLSNPFLIESINETKTLIYES
jgi:predicted nucleotidyltransferase